MEFIIENWDLIAAAVGGVVATASAIIRLTPSKKDDAVFNQIVGFFSALGLKTGWKLPLTPIKIEEEK